MHAQVTNIVLPLRSPLLCKSPLLSQGRGLLLCGTSPSGRAIVAKVRYLMLQSML